MDSRHIFDSGWQYEHAVEISCFVGARIGPEAESNGGVSSRKSIRSVRQSIDLSFTFKFGCQVSESGPPHMKNFVVECKLGEYTTSGDGNCKKVTFTLTD